MSEWTRTAEDHPVSLWELLEEERMIAHKLACSCDRHIFFCQFLRRVMELEVAGAAHMKPLDMCVEEQPLGGPLEDAHGHHRQL